MQRLFCAFPAGRPGAGLLLLRSAVGLTALVEGASLAGGNQTAGTVLSVAAGALAIASGALLLLGFLTPIAASVVSGLGVAVQLSDDGRASVFVVIVAIAVVLLGPGAFSVDSRLFGRREVVIPRRKTA